MSYLSTKKSLVAILGAMFFALKAGELATANEFTPTSLFQEVKAYKTIIDTNRDPADIYFPIASKKNISTQKFPIALLLPGALVDKSQYSKFASIVASYGFVVIVPNHIRSLPASGLKRLLPDTSQVNNVFAYMVKENSNSASPIFGTLNIHKLVLLGHSAGGASGIAAINNSCIAPYCEGEFQRPKEIVAGVFYGTNFRDRTRKFLPTKNNGIPLALVQGSQDGVALPERAKKTYELIQDPPKALITIAGANHFGITNVNHPPGAKPDPLNPTLEQDKAIETIARWSALFLRAYTLNDRTAFDYIHTKGDALDENVTITSQTKPKS
ncbi:alpha/beta hydrolase [Nostocales cyanobacterium HT-58-2]|nr:alpha/beta hydrolase [Nostocales cyanobacterium HT-58-2]